MKTAEQRVAEAVLQDEKTIEVGGKTYQVAPPSIATLIRVSDLVSQMPEMNAQPSNPVSEVLRVAKDGRLIGDIIATIILGAKRIRDFKTSMFGKKKTELDELSDSLLHEKTPAELQEILSDFISNRMDIGFFLSIGVFLSGVNMTKPTKKGTTPSGPQ